MISRKIIVPTNEVTNEMKDTLEICEISPDNSKTVFRLIGDKPSCFNKYDDINSEEFHELRLNNKNIWHPIPSWAPDDFAPEE